MSKGCWRRPTQVDKKTFAERWDRAFGVDKYGTGKGAAKTYDPDARIFCDHTDYACASGICPECGQEVPDK